MLFSELGCTPASCTQVHIKDTEHLGNFPDRQQQL